ncbi:MAG: peptidoglycan bridge formation glycyltransferase FemA/FemB family protein [Treponema sp.]|jgi:lipid II:glycine glycyltransferase (peptidoglycan interpeptide bridge formation enzyme)|nr:peptidoglycan bridge formation glycyltransferase FemA/FemB family protein [Treponema sp.]
MIYYKKKNKTNMAEIWYNYDEQPAGRIDVLRYKYVTERKENAASFEELWTLLIDLEKPEDELFSRMRKSTRYQINRAKNKDHIVHTTLLDKGEKDEEKINRYIDFYNAFADSKNRSHIHVSDIEQFYNTGTLCVRSASTGTEPLTMHAYVVSDNTARLHQSSSLFRVSQDGDYKNLIARANRLLHWEDALYFKRAHGIRWYDFGGWYGGGGGFIQKNYEQLLIKKINE